MEILFSKKTSKAPICWKVLGHIRTETREQLERPFKPVLCITTFLPDLNFLMIIYLFTVFEFSTSVGSLFSK